MKVSIELPKVSRGRLFCTLAMASLATTLWIIAPAYLPFATVDAKHVLVGIAVPFGVGYVTLLLLERRIAVDLTAADLDDEQAPAEAVTR